MDAIKEAISMLGIPGSIATVLIVTFVVLQLIGELLELKGKLVPEWMKIRKFFKRRKLQEAERIQALKDVKELLSTVNHHYDEDNISRRNEWIAEVNRNIEWTHDRAQVYDDSISKLTSSMDNVVAELTKLRVQNEEDHAQRIRNKIIEFASKIVREDYRATKDEFNYIFRIYHEYEEYITLHHIQNDQINSCIEIIREEYSDYVRHNRFLEAKRTLPD